MDNIFQFNTCCSFVICRFKCSSSLKQDGFSFAVNVFIVHQLEKILLFSILQTFLQSSPVISAFYTRSQSDMDMWMNPFMCAVI